MQLGAFSISIAVKDIKASKDFYEKFGFQVFHGDITQNWLILKNDETTIGLFQGMFEKKYSDLQPGLGQRCKRAGKIHRHSPAAAAA